MSECRERALMNTRRPVGRPVAGARLLSACMATALCLTVHAASADDTAAPDCRPHAINAEVEGAPLTREEKIARLDQALHDSLARFEQCQQAASGAAGGAKGGAAGGMAGGAGAGGGDGSRAGSRANGADSSESGEGGDVAGGAIESVAASGIQGTESPVADTPSSRTMTSGTGLSPNAPPGAIPKDILALGRDGALDPDNDSRLEAQIRLAAMNETDPKQKARLWNEYRRYKGVPLKPVTHTQGDADAQQESE